MSSEEGVSHPLPDENEKDQAISEQKNELENIASHYSKIKLEKDRRQSSILPLRSLNNFLKSSLLSSYIRPGFKIIDLGCGRGGDIHKYSKLGVSHVTFVDISPDSLRELEERLSESGASYSSEILNSSISSPDLVERINPDHFEDFDVASAMFCFHYLFSSVQNVHNFFVNCNKLLKKGGVLLLTFTDPEIVEAYYEKQGSKFGNDFYEIVVHDEGKKIKNLKDRVGANFEFSLEEAVEKLPEYVVPHDKLVDVSAENGFQIEENVNFVLYLIKILSGSKGYYNRNRLRNKLVQDEKDKEATGIDGICYDEVIEEDEKEYIARFDEQLWEIFRLYKVIVLRKIN